MKRSIFTIALLTGSLFYAFAQQQGDTLQMQNLVERVLLIYPSIQQAKESIRKNELEEKIQRSVYLPTLTGSATYTYIDPTSKLDMGGRTIHIQSDHNTNIGVTLSQLIYDFGKNKPLVQSLRLQKEIAQLQEQNIQQTLTLQTIQKYLYTLLYRESILIKKKQLVQSEKFTQQTKLLRETGSATEYDLLNAKAQEELIKSQLAGLFKNINIQYVQISSLADTIINNQTKMHFSAIPETPLKELTILTTQALANRFEMQIARKETDVAEIGKVAAANTYNPTLSAGISGGMSNGYEPNIDKLNPHVSLGVTFRMPLYEGSRRKHKINLAKSSINQAQANLQLIEKNIKEEVAQYYYTLTSDIQVLKQMQVAQEAAKSAYEQALVNYDAGAATSLDLITSSNNLANAQLALLQQKINYEIGYYQLMIALGNKAFENMP